MTEPQPVQTAAPPPFRLDVEVRDLLQKPRPKAMPPPLRPGGPDQLPEPVFPQHPELLGENGTNYEDLNSPLHKRRWSPQYIYRAIRCWGGPYVRSRLLPGDFHPIIAYLFTEWKCNLDCHYCWAFDNRVKGMTEEVARRSIDWLRDTGCRVLALMGGEPLLRPQFIHKVVYHAVKQGFWVYLPTNGRLMRPEVIDWLGDAGLASVNLAMDAWDVKPGLPKALVPIRPYFDYLIKRQHAYGITVFLNVNICRTNHEDVKRLTELAHEKNLSIDYHINESPMIEQTDYKHLNDNDTFIRPADFPRVDDLIDWLIEKQRSGYKMVNPIRRLQEMKEFMRGKVQSWNCRAGQNSLIVRVDGTLAPCFPLYSATYDWGTIENHKFETPQLAEMKKDCQTHCFSTLNHNLAYCYNDQRVIKWMIKQAKNKFQGTTGAFD